LQVSNCNQMQAIVTLAQRLAPRIDFARGLLLSMEVNRPSPNSTRKEF